MADFTVSASLGPQTYNASVSPADARMMEFLDDLIDHYGEIDDGAGGTRPMTRAEVGQKWLDDLVAGQVRFAKGLKQRRLNAAVTEADDLEGNT